MITKLLNHFYITVDPEKGYLFYKDGDKKVPLKNVSGRLVKIEEREVQYKDEFIKKLQLTMGEDDNLYKISFGLKTNLTKTVLNTLLSVKVFKPEQEFLILTYKKDGYIKLFMQCDGNKLQWKYGPDELNKFEDTDFRRECIDEIAMKINPDNDSQEEQRAKADDDIPF